MAKIISSGINVNVARNQARELLERFDPIRQAGIRGGINDQQLRAMNDVLGKWATEGTKTVEQFKTMDYLLKSQVNKNLEVFARELKGGSDAATRFIRDVRDLAESMTTIGEDGAMAAGGAGLLSKGLLGVGLGAAALGLYGLARGTAFSFGQGMHEQASQQAFFLGGGHVLGNFNSLIAATRHLNAQYGIDVNQTREMALTMGHLGGSSGTRQMVEMYTAAARLSRALGLTNEEGAQAFGQMKRLGVDTREWERLGAIIGEAAAKAGLSGRQGEMLQALVTAQQQISTHLLTADASAQMGINATTLAKLTGSGIPGLSMGLGLDFLNQTRQGFAGAFNLPNTGKPVAQLSLLRATHGNIYDALNLQMRMAGGQLPESNLLLSMLDTNKMFGNSPMGRLEQKQTLLQLTGRYFGDDQLKNLIDALKKGTPSEKALKEALGKDYIKSRQAAEESLTEAMTKFSQDLSTLGGHMLPTLGKVVKDIDSLVKWWDAHSSKPLAKVVSDLDEWISDIKKHGLFGGTYDFTKDKASDWTTEHITKPMAELKAHPPLLPGGKAHLDLNAPKEDYEEMMKAISALGSAITSIYAALSHGPHMGVPSGAAIK